MRPEQLSKQKQKYVQSLHLKKNRTETGLFLVEGIKNIAEALQENITFDHIYLTPKGKDALEPLLTQQSWSLEKPESVQKVSTLQVNEDGVAVAVQRKMKKKPLVGLNLVLDGIKDPGNLGTLLRLADWYAVQQVWCSLDCVELYNPKVISASMGSFARVDVHYEDLSDLLSQGKLPSFGAFLGGKSVYEIEFPEDGFLIIGSESHGIRPHLEPLITSRLTIPRRGQAESLNASFATGILLDNWFRPLK